MYAYIHTCTKSIHTAAAGPLAGYSLMYIYDLYVYGIRVLYLKCGKTR